jgi:hypothetical protein
MESPPSLFLYEERAGAHCLYAAPLSTSDGLAMLEPSAATKVTELGATGFRNLGWATEADIPPMADVAALRAFLDAEPGLGLIELAVQIEGFGSLSSHDDGECHFSSPSRARILAVLTRLAPPAHAGRLTAAVLAGPGAYFSCSPNGALIRYSSFDDWLERGAP